jgi:hypothetical protein
MRKLRAIPNYRELRDKLKLQCDVEEKIFLLERKSFTRLKRKCSPRRIRRGRAAIEARNVSRKACPGPPLDSGFRWNDGSGDAKAAKKIPLSSPFGKGGKRGI